ncbi:MAG: hypothetical protein JF609_04715 [Verrucomicrobia bacterium]|nr:hypothetical protein [Verrucomicrobiota bacterium]
MSTIRFIFLLAALVLIAGCMKPTQDPLSGFHASDLQNLDSNKTITDDYKNYIQKLSPKENQYMGPILYFEDGTRRHAVRIETDIGGKDCWYHILVYDKDDKRIKAIKYYNGRYQS